MVANAIPDEYAALAHEAGFTMAELAQVARNGFAVADLDAAVKQRHLAEIDRVETAFNGLS